MSPAPKRCRSSSRACRGDFQKIGNAVAAGLYAFGRPTTLDGKPASEVTVTVAGNRAQIGPIEVDLPRLPL